MADVGLRSVINGPEGFTPDNEFCLGETAVAGFFVAAGFCAHGIAGAGGIGKMMAEWVVDGEPEFDLWHMDIGRFGAAYASPSYTLARTIGELPDLLRHRLPRHRAAVRPAAADVAGLRLARRARCGLRREGRLGAGQLLRAPTRTRRSRACGRDGWAGRDWSPATAVEHRRDAHDGRAVRRDLLRQDRGRAGRTPRASSSGSATTEVAREVDATHLHPGAQPARRHRGRLHRHPPRGRTVLGDHRDGVRHPRPRLAAQAGPARRHSTSRLTDVDGVAGDASPCGVRPRATSSAR